MSSPMIVSSMKLVKTTSKYKELTGREIYGSDIKPSADTKLDTIYNKPETTGNWNEILSICILGKSIV